MSRRKQKSTAPLLDQLSAPLKEFVEDFGRHGKSVLERVRERSPEKYLELSCKLASLVAALKPKGDDLDSANNSEELGIALLHAIDMEDDQIDEKAIQLAIKANDEFCQRLDAIKRKRSQKHEKTEVDEAEAVIKHLQDTTGLPS
jgi:hypothetical protein